MNKKYLAGLAFFVSAIALLAVRNNSETSEQPHGQKRQETSSTLPASPTPPKSNIPFSGENNSHDPGNFLLKSLTDIQNKYKNSLDPDERLHLTARLASLAADARNNSMNAALGNLLNIATQDDDKEVRSFAVMNYSRIANADQAIDLLKTSRTKGTIDSQTYYSELARIYLRLELPEDRADSVLDEIIAEKNEYTSEVIFSTLTQTNPSLISEVQTKKLIAYLQDNFPEFPKRFTSLGVVDTLNYTDWILSLAILSTGSHDKEITSSYLLKHFENGFLDPREAVSLTLSDPFRDLNQSESAIKLRQILWEETMRYAAAYPDNPVIEALGITPEDQR